MQRRAKKNNTHTNQENEIEKAHHKQEVAEEERESENESNEKEKWEMKEIVKIRQRNGAARKK